MPETNRMNCPDCGAEMNHHADKLVHGAAEDEGRDAADDGVVVESHTCPGCGRAATRAAAQ